MSTVDSDLVLRQNTGQKYLQLLLDGEIDPQRKPRAHKRIRQMMAKRELMSTTSRSRCHRRQVVTSRPIRRSTELLWHFHRD
jgi:hypothetical protein